jgi:hypothetical protein
MAAVTMSPLLSTEPGLTPKKAGFQITRSASLPASMADLVGDAVGRSPG